MQPPEGISQALWNAAIHAGAWAIYGPSGVRNPESRGEAEEVLRAAYDKGLIRFTTKEDLDREYLSGAYNETGIAQWWDRPRSQLDGRTPNQAWDSAPQKVISLAKSTRDMMST